VNRVALAAAFALLAFAANSILCRMALRQASIDPASFTTVRLVAGAFTLWVLVGLGKARSSAGGNWISACALLAYAAAFSFAYVAVTAGTGALLLFGAVQLIMISVGLVRGERIDLQITLGWLLAVAGVVILVFPGVSAAPPIEAALMLGAGVAWGIYSLRGRRSSDPLRDTAGNFIRAAPGALLVSAVMWRQSSFDGTGVLLAALSGSLASGIGYAAWYVALPRLSAIAAANLQLSVPLIAALAGVVLFGEPITVRLAVSSILLLGGIALATRRSIELSRRTGGASTTTRA
jgi:drug/metabolite transporter (DMT)-like permease